MPWINEVVEMIAETKEKNGIYVSQRSHAVKKVSRELAHKLLNSSPLSCATGTTAIQLNLNLTKTRVWHSLDTTRF